MDSLGARRVVVLNSGGCDNDPMLLLSAQAEPAWSGVSCGAVTLFVDPPHFYAIKLASLPLSSHTFHTFTHPSASQQPPTLASLVSSRPPFVHPQPPRRAQDEDFINRSLLDSLDAQADAEPLSSSDSEAPTAPSFASSLSASSVGSPQYQPSTNQLRPDSPHTHFDSFSPPTMYNNMHSDFPSHSDLDHQKLAKLDNLVPPGPYRTSTAFNAFSNARSRQASIPANNPQTFRDTSNLSQNFPIDIYTATQSMSSPPHQPATSTFEHVLPRGSYDFIGAPQGPPGLVGQNKALFNNVDPFAQQLHKQAGLFSPGAQQQQAQAQPPQQQLNGLHATTQASFLNGLHPQQMQSQTPYGPHLPASASTPTVSQVNHSNSATQPSSQEEISTIFVVGFPEDMQEREFQNMFTFSPGFEAATLKIPNKELTAYGSASASSANAVRPGYSSHGGPNDPYNLVTINQGGVVVDGGRDGTTSSWQPADDAHFSHLVSNGPAGPGGTNTGMSTRKQIIGFAKFRTRAEALDARDTLQGRRIDIEKGAVLKAEMAKKNLHTKRGIGPLPPQLSTIIGTGGGTVPPEALASMPGMNGLTSLSSQAATAAGEALSARERELGTLGAMGFAGINGRRDNRLDAHEDDLSSRKVSIPFGNATARGVRDRFEEEQRKWKEKAEADKERNARLRSSDSYAFDAFHSVPSSQRPTGNSLLAATAGEAIGPLPSRAVAAPPWGALARDPVNNTSRKMSVPISSTLPPRPSSPPSQPPHPSPLPRDVTPFASGAAIGSFTPSHQNTTQPAHPSLPSRPRAYSPASGGETAVPFSSGSSAAGSQGSVDEEVPRSLASLAVSTMCESVPSGTGSTSPQLPSPASGASSEKSGRNGIVDQNPPLGFSQRESDMDVQINTLYVGNLPSSPPPPGYGPNHLEDSLRTLFSHQPGFRKLCFRQKSNGPMCFVEFVDVQHATKALNELYGSTLGGLVKGGGIRISYSKNPLGVRTPTNPVSGSIPQPPAGFISSGVTYPPEVLQLDVSQKSGRDVSGITSTSSLHYGFNVASPPPPRFVSPPPGPTSLNQSTFPRQAVYGLGPSPAASLSSSSSFSPFGISPSPHPSTGNSSNQFSPIPEQTNHTNFTLNSINSNNNDGNLISDTIEQQQQPMHAMSTLTQNSV
ncbi:hypothetical protein F5148DRAFT_1150060 [Russula earlei]|uniref:Uncharacterized protein n=1 Tax=Russula earlei TaxID=71964 RepID=A0ACC0U762_9AGAM|nr:hypothetical protein F5148DRAFT_1150060 [Russula earlei]